jgi:hypothetical protein
MAIQPNHRATATKHYIFPDDDAWDRKKIDRELGLIDANRLLESPSLSDELRATLLAEIGDEVVPWANRDEHPVVQFRDGSARFDSSTIREYLLPGRKPSFVVMRSISHTAWLDLQSLMEREVNVVELVMDEDGKPKKDEDGKPITVVTNVSGRAASLDCAIRHVVLSIDDLGVKASKQGLTDGQLEQLRELLGDDRFTLLGYACLASTRSLTPAESFR